MLDLSSIGGLPLDTSQWPALAPAQFDTTALQQPPTSGFDVQDLLRAVAPELVSPSATQQDTKGASLLDSLVAAMSQSPQTSPADLTPPNVPPLDLSKPLPQAPLYHSQIPVPKNIPQYRTDGGIRVQPSDMDTLLGLGASLLGGGGLGGFIYRGSSVLGAQQAAAEYNYDTAQARFKASPAGQMQQRQQGIYQARMEQDVDRFLRATSDPSNPLSQLSSEEKDSAYQQIVDRYAPLGLNLPPRPSELDRWFKDDAAPELSNIDMVKTLKQEYGDSIGKTAELILHHDPKGGAEKLLDLQLKLKQIDAINAKAVHIEQKKQIESAKKALQSRIESNRKLDLEYYHAIGANAGQVSKSGQKGVITREPAYLQGEAAINDHYDKLLAGVDTGNANVGTRLFDSSSALSSNPKDFNSFIGQIRNRVNRTDPSQLQIATFPPSIADDAPEVVAAARNGNVLPASDPRVRAALEQGKAVLIQLPNGLFSVARPKSGV